MNFYIKSIPWKDITGLPTLRGIKIGIPAQRSTLILFVMALYITTFAIDSPLRYTLNLLHCAPLIYIRDLSIIALLAFELLQWLEEKKAHKGGFIIMSLIVFHMLIGFVLSRNIPQTLFGFKTLLPFIGGMLATINLSNLQKLRFSKILKAIWAITIVGIILEKVGIPFPWKGFSLGIGDFKIEGNRSWESVGISRLAGFTRASFDAAIIISTLPFFFMFSLRRSLRALVILLSLIAIAWTITKSVLIGFFVIAIISTILEFRLPLRRLVSISIILFGSCLMIALPLYFDGEIFHTDRADLLQEFLLGSFRERINWTWPDAWTYISEPIVSIVGVGIGGIGVAQSYFSAGSFQPGDNMFVYFRVMFGIPAYLYLAYAIKKGIGYSAHSKPYALLLAMFFFFGVSMSLIESAVGAFSLGYLLTPYINKAAESFRTRRRELTPPQ